MERLVLCAAFGCLMSVANARDLGQWESVNPGIREWYQALMQPDNPSWKILGRSVQLPERSLMYISGLNLKQIVDNLSN